MLALLFLLTMIEACHARTGSYHFYLLGQRRRQRRLKAAQDRLAKLKSRHEVAGVPIASPTEPQFSLPPALPVFSFRQRQER